MIYHYNITQGTPEWHELRRGIITASVASQLLTPTLKVASNDTVRKMVLKRAAERITGRSEQDGATTYHTERGHREEVLARNLYSQHYAPVTECGMVETSRLGFRIGYSPDGLVGDDGLIEIKSRMAKYQVETICAQAVPSEYAIQLQFGLLVTGRPWIDFIQYSNGMALYVQRVTPDAVVFEALEEALSLFEERVVAMVEDYMSKAKGLVVADYVDVDADFEVEE